MDSLTGKLGMGIGDYGMQDSNKEDAGIKMVDKVVKSFRVAKLFRENTDRINHMDFSASGDLLISSAEDDQIVIYDCEKGLAKRTLNSKKYGVDLIHFTHAKNTAIHSSTKIDDTIRYLSLHDNKYLRYFPGHTKKVTTLCMSPTDDTFLSGSLDKQLRLWDLRSPNCQGLMHLTGKPVAAFDPEGLIFAAGVSSEVVKLYDLRSFDKGPFATFKFAYEKDNDWTSLKFSPDGKTMMICSNGSVIRIIDAFHGTPLQTFVISSDFTKDEEDDYWWLKTIEEVQKQTEKQKSVVKKKRPQAGHANNKSHHLEASYSPDSQYVFCGSSDGIIYVWNVESGYKVCCLNADHPGPVECVKFNPKFMMMATACTNMAFWLPTADD